ncbi:hypothetical protein [Actinoplanes sp. NPDC049316]|uniref:hypothetical protein n=1 Tax=Actinoplanes sp. NPDC049316 TaxID=3154727 RepID=UPI0034361A68
MLLTIAGSSCSGKTTAAWAACADMQRLVVHDFDEIGVPSDADRQWRQRSTEAWLSRVLRYQADGVDVVLTGQSPLGEVLACPSATRLEAIAACLLDVDDEFRESRLEERDPGKWDPDAKRSFMAWARWNRGHAGDPGHQPEAIMPGWQEMRWERWSDWTGADPRWAVEIVDTTGRGVQRSAADVRRWVRTARSQFARGHLGLAGD